MVRTCETCGAPIIKAPHEGRRYLTRRYCGRACGWRLQPIEIRFWRYVQKSPGCWEWTGTRQNGPGGTKRYGKLGIGGSGRQRFAHHLAWEFAFGPIPAGLWVLHRCDNPPCVNPAHLFLGTVQDNVADMLAKGRQRLNPLRGEGHPRARVSEADVQVIRERSRSGETYRALARDFGISAMTVSYIVRRMTWRHVA